MLSSKILMQMKSRVIPLIEYMHIYNVCSLSGMMLAYTLNISVRDIVRRVRNIVIPSNLKTADKDETHNL